MKPLTPGANNEGSKPRRHSAELPRTRNRHDVKSIREIYHVNGEGVLRALPVDALNSAAPDLPRFPYGATVLPVTDATGDAVVVFKQPGAAGRGDVLVIEKPASLIIRGSTLGEKDDPREAHRGRARVRVAMEHLANDVGNLPASVAVVRVATSIGANRSLNGATQRLMATVAYSIRPYDEVGWFEHGDGTFPDISFRHGHPDVATREQGDAGIRGPSWLAVGLRRGVRRSRFAPRRRRALQPGQRVIYELHVGTFTAAGTFAAAAQRLPYLRRTGLTTIQVMPVDIGSGPPGWTYDQTRTGAVESVYGGATGFIQFVECAHACGLEVIVDKQYNHQGPEQDSRRQLIPTIFNRETKWGPGLSGKEVPSYPQIVKLIGEELAYWVTEFGVDGFRLDATNRLPWEIHEQIARLCRGIVDAVGKPLYVLSEYAECEEPMGMRVPTGHQYGDQAGRLLMKLLDLSKASHVTGLATDCGSVLRPMLKAARRGWWYPEVSPPQVSEARNARRRCCGTTIGSVIASAANAFHI